MMSLDQLIIYIYQRCVLIIRFSGVQGALLSALMHPILPEIVIFGMRAPIDDCSLGYALYSRLSDDRYPFMLESANVSRTHF